MSMLLLSLFFIFKEKIAHVAPVAFVATAGGNPEVPAAAEAEATYKEQDFFDLSLMFMNGEVHQHCKIMNKPWDICYVAVNLLSLGPSICTPREYRLEITT